MKAHAFQLVDPTDGFFFFFFWGGGGEGIIV
jgi:hypothetical protein